MNIKSGISRTSLQEELYKKGASKNLIKMPAVIIATNGAISDGKKISIGQDGEINIQSTDQDTIAKIISLPNGEAKYEARYKFGSELRGRMVNINSYGMEYKRNLYRLNQENEKVLLSTVERNNETRKYSLYRLFRFSF